MSMTPYYDDGQITIYHGDCREILPTLDTVDLVLTDPPYGIGAKWARSEWNAASGKSRLWGKGETWDDHPVEQGLLDSAICAGRNAIVWGGNYYSLPPSAQWLIWDKDQEFSGADAELAWTNLPGTVRRYRLSRVEANTNRGNDPKTHPTEKPRPLMRWCIGFAPDAQTILDPFMGSGTTLRAAKDLGRKAIGIEIEERYCEIAVERLRQGVLV